jgi:hypothetical protein
MRMSDSGSRSWSWLLAGAQQIVQDRDGGAGSELPAGGEGRLPEILESVAAVGAHARSAPSVPGRCYFGGSEVDS